jgi:hypothetical protein
MKGINNMRYYIMEQFGNTRLPAAPKGKIDEAILATDLGSFCQVDYDEHSGLIGEKLKLLMELFMPEYEFEPVVYLDMAKGEQVVFWRFQPPLYSDFHAIFRKDGIVSSISFPNNHAPIVFTAKSPMGARSVIVRMAVAESALRREIFRVKFTKVSE